jgi:hypothetical protein
MKPRPVYWAVLSQISQSRSQLHCFDARLHGCKFWSKWRYVVLRATYAQRARGAWKARVGYAAPTVLLAVLSTRCHHSSMTHVGSPPEDGARIPLVPISGGLPAWLADLASIAADLETAHRFIERYIELARNRPSDGESPVDTDMQALWNAGVIAYRRAFTSGRSLVLPKESRPKLADKILAQLSEDGRTTHESLWDQANKHVAHRVADLEQARIYAALAPEGSEPSIQGVARLHVRFIGPDPADASKALNLCTKVHDIVMRELETLTAGATSALAADVDVESLYEVWELLQQSETGPS